MKFSKIFAAAALLSVSVAYAQQPAPQDAAQQTQYENQNSANASHRNAADGPHPSDCAGPASYCSVYFGGS